MRAVRVAGGLFLQRVFGAGTPIVLGVVVLRALGSEQFGRFALIVAAVSGAQFVVEFGLDKYLPREFTKAGPEVALFRRWLAFKLGLAAILYVPVIVVGCLGGSPREVVVPVAVYSLVLFTHAFTSNWRSLFIAEASTDRIAVASLAGAVTTFALTATLLALDATRGLASVAVALVIGALVELIVLTGRPADWQIVKPAGLRPVRQFLEIWEFAAQSVLATIYTRTPIVVLGLLGGSVAVANYSMGANIYTGLGLVPVALATAAYPGLTRTAWSGRKGALAHAVRRHVVAAFLLLTPIAVLIAIAAEPILRAIYGIAPPAAVVAFRILMASVVVVGMNSILAVALFARYEHRRVVLLSVVTVTVAFLASVMLIAIYREVGAAMAVLTADVTTALVFFPALARAAARLDRADVVTNGARTGLRDC